MLAAALAAAAAALATPAYGDAGGSIPTYDVVLTIRPDGVLHVRETITYDFADDRHGIVRSVPYRIDNRLYGIRNVRASSSTGAPAEPDVAKLGHEMRIAVGDGGRTVRGRQAYVIEYDVVGTLTPRERTAELRWDATGPSWPVPIGEVSVRVEAPVRRPRASCWAGPTGGPALTRCGRDREGPYAAAFTQHGLDPGESALIMVRLPRDAVRVPPPRFARPHFTGTWLGLTALAAGLLAGAAARRRPWRPVRWQGRFRWSELRQGVGWSAVAAGAGAVLADAAGEMVRDGIWAVSVGDRALAGVGLIAAGIMAVSSLPGPGGAEQDEPASAPDRRA